MSIKRSKLGSALRRARFALLGEPPFQIKRIEGTNLRWNKIVSHLDSSDRCAMDIGCNAGFVVRGLADRGMLAIGFDASKEIVDRTRRAHRDVQALALVHLKMTPDAVVKLPTVDVAFCLSIFHYWVNEFGEQAAWDMVGAIAARSRKFFFEPSSAHYKYRQLGLKQPVTAPAPEFIDLDATSIEAWVHKNMARVAPGRRLHMLGSIPCIAADPFRLLFLLDPA